MNNKNTIDLQTLWNTQKITPTPIAQIYDQVHTLQKKQKTQKTVLSLCFIGTSLVFIILWYVFPSMQYTTCLGMLCILLAMGVFIWQYLRYFKNFKNINPASSNKTYLAQILSLQKQQHQLHTKSIGCYFILLSLGISLQLWEYLIKMDRGYAILAGGLTLAWIAFNWWYLRPKIIKKQQKEIQKIIEDIKSTQAFL